MSLHPKLVPVQYRECEYGLFNKYIPHYVASSLCNLKVAIELKQSRDALVRPDDKYKQTFGYIDQYFGTRTAKM